MSGKQINRFKPGFKYGYEAGSGKPCAGRMVLVKSIPVPVTNQLRDLVDEILAGLASLAG